MGNIALWIAARFVPARTGMRELQTAQAQIVADMACAIIHSNPERGGALLREAFSNLGRGTGERLKRRFRVQPTLSDLSAVWRAVCNLGGVGYTISKKPQRAIFKHTTCPLWEEFLRRSELHCLETCLPMITALTQAIAPEAQVELIREPDSADPCIKAIFLEEKQR